MKALDILVVLIVIIGAINWGLVGAFQFDAVMWLATTVGMIDLAKIIYIVVGVCGVLALYTRFLAKS